jgi:hypothetical protein
MLELGWPAVAESIHTGLGSLSNNECALVNLHCISTVVPLSRCSED